MQHLPTNTLLQGGKYKIERVLGQGGFGITYLAVQVGLNRQVAIKEFFMREYCNRDTDTSHVTVGSEGSRDVVEKFRSKFVKEAQNIACLKHPHIISIYDVFEENGTAYYVMEYLDHGSLAELVKRQGHLSEADALSYIRQIADALRYIHARKMNHLDVKPGNILIDETDGAVLIDFGLSKRYDDEGNQTSTTPVGISHGYAPLEQYKRGGVGTFSPSTDIYSLGATLYKLITGDTPPDANDVNDEGLPAFPSYVSASVASAIEQAMQPRRKDRPQTIEAFLALLDTEFKVEDEATMLDVEDKYENKEEHLTYPQGNSSSSLSFSFKKHFLPAVACVVVVLAVVLTISMQEKFLSVKEQYELAQNYYNGHGVTQDYVKAVEWYHKAAERGYADAQYKLGVCYYDGLGVTQDYAQSFEWCKKAAEHGLPNAQNQVGFCYKMGRGVEPDTVKALEWYRKAAEQGQVNAQNNLGNSYYAGHGVTQDYAKAVEWYRKAAEQGFADAQYMLGLCYYDGLGVTQDYVQSFEWCKKAAEHGLPYAQNQVGFCYKMGRGVEPDTVKAVEWYRKAAEQGQVNAQNNLGNSYYAGHGVTQDYAKAVEWYRKAAEQGFADAQYMLGLCYYHSLGVTQDYAKAVEWYRKAAEQGFADAQYMLGLCYYDGLGVTQDYAQSFEWCKKAAEHGLPNAQNQVGFCYKMGRGVEPDTVKALEWYRKAAEQGQVNAQSNLGNSYYAGHGVTQDYAKAVEWYRKAAEQGFADAQYMLGLCYYDGLGVTQDYGEAVKWFRKAADFGLAKAKDALKQLENLLTEKPKPQPTTGTINGHEYVDLGLSVKWATCNVGASSPSDFGNYYAWGETDTKSEYTFSNSKTWKKHERHSGQCLF